jgi:hypothetical protein
MEASNLSFSLSHKGVSAPELNLDDYPADIALSFQRQLLHNTLIEATRSGLYCVGHNGLGQSMTAGELLPLFAPDLLAALHSDTPVRTRIQPTTTPILGFNANASSLSLTWDALHVEVYTRIWGADWLVLRAQEVNLKVTGLVPDLGGDQRVRLIGGSWKVSNTKQPELASVLKQIVLHATDGLQLFAIPDLSPYPLKEARFEVQAEHLLVYANLDTSAAPALRAVKGAVVVVESPRNERSAGGCSLGKNAPNVYGLSLLAFLALLMWQIQRSGAMRRRRRNDG